jgi:hypothetical protein
MKQEYPSCTSVDIFHEDEFIEIFRKPQIMKFTVGVSSRILAGPEDGHREICTKVGRL